MPWFSVTCFTLVFKVIFRLNICSDPAKMLLVINWMPSFYVINCALSAVLSISAWQHWVNTISFWSIFMCVHQSVRSWYPAVWTDCLQSRQDVSVLHSQWRIFLFRLQNKGIASQDQYLHQDTCARRRAGVCGDWQKGRCSSGSTGSTICCWAFHPNTVRFISDLPSFAELGFLFTLNCPFYFITWELK